MRRRTATRLAALLAATAVLSIATLGPARATTTPRPEVVRVETGRVTPTSTSGSGLGTVRTYWMPMAVDGVAADGQYTTGTLTTVAIGLPGDLELRLTNLAFVFGTEVDQIVLGGVARYPASGAFLAEGQRTVRPIVGASGRYAGVVGYAVSINRGANGWLHVFHLSRRA